MMAVRQLLQKDKDLLGPYLSFIHDQLSAPISDNCELNYIRGGVLRCFAVLSDVVDAGVMWSLQVVEIIRNYVISESSSKAGSLAAHRRGIAVVILSRFMTLLVFEDLKQDIIVSLQAILSCLCDLESSVYTIALSSMKDLLWYPQLKPTLASLAPQTLDWLVGLLQEKSTGIYT